MLRFPYLKCGSVESVASCVGLPSFRGGWKCGGGCDCETGGVCEGVYLFPGPNGCIGLVEFLSRKETVCWAGKEQGKLFQDNERWDQFISPQWRCTNHRLGFLGTFEPTFAGLWREVVLYTVPFFSLHLVLFFFFF